MIAQLRYTYSLVAQIHLNEPLQPMHITRHHSPFSAARQICLPLILLIVALTLDSAWGEVRPPVRVTFFDVGRGDAILIEQPGRCAVLIDAGPPGSGTRIGEDLRARRIDRLDRLIVSHPHLDHFGGIFSLPAGLAIEMVNDNGVDFHDEHLFSAYQHWRQRQNYRPLASGERWLCGDTVFTVLAVNPEKWRPEEINDTSLVLLAEAGPVRLLLPGDIEAYGRRKLVAASGLIPAQVVKIPHHARSPGHLGPWLDAVSPELSVISTGREAGPDPEALRLIRQKSETVWRTDTQGDLELLIDERGWRYAR